MSDALFMGHPSESQSLFLMDIIRNTQQINLEHLLYDIQITNNLTIHQAYRPRTRHRNTQPPEREPVPVVHTPPPRTTRPVYKEKVVTLYKKQSSEQEECSICQETHCKLDTTTMDTCKHTFGTQCISHWMDICWTRDRKRANCPSCRVDIYNVTKYRERATPVQKPRKKKPTPTTTTTPKQAEEEEEEQPEARIIMPHQVQTRVQLPELWTPNTNRIIMPHQRMNL